ncbi:MAG: hypothetical protein LBD53_05665 [Tannerella sp.]|jgi:hypothetical protein|nr:hypothetical protein [Tannerella sp.]
MNTKTTLLIFACAVALFANLYFLNRMTKMRQTQSQLQEFTSGVQQREDFYRRNIEKLFASTGLKAKTATLQANTCRL